MRGLDPLKALKKLINQFLGASGYSVVNKSGYQDICLRHDKNEEALRALRKHLVSESHLNLILEDLSQPTPIGLAEKLEFSRSQIGQDLFVISQKGMMEPGNFFVEFGATDGVNMSNTYMLEKHFQWRGILAEPARIWKERLLLNRKCSIDTRCIFPESGQFVDFLEVNKNPSNYLAIPELSGVAEFSSDDDWAHGIRAEHSSQYKVETVSLMDLLKEHNAPSRINYLSIDTEGSELAILESFDFSMYEIDVITIEHNYKEEIRSQIHNLLSGHGFTRTKENLSKFDDWYLSPRLV